MFPSCSAAAAAAEHIHAHSVELPRCPGLFLSLAFTTNICHHTTGQELHQQLDKIISAHRQTAEALAEPELNSCCHTDPGDYAGTCSSDSSDTPGSSSDTPGSSVCKDTEEQQYKEQLDSSSASSSIGASEGNAEAEGIEGSHKEAEGGGGDRGSSGGSNGGSSGKQSGVLRALKARVLGGSGSGKNSSKDEEMQVGVCGGGGAE